MVHCLTSRSCFLVVLILCRLLVLVVSFQPLGPHHYSRRWPGTRSATSSARVVVPGVGKGQDRNYLLLSPRRRRTSSRTTTQLHGGAVVAATATLATTIDALFKSAPYAAAAITCGIKASSADWVAQKRQFHKRNDEDTVDDNAIVVVVRQQQQQQQHTDWKRNIAFLLYGAIYQGMAQEFIYNHLYPSMFGSGVSVGVVLSKVAFDLLIQTTLVTLPIAYLTKALIYKYSAKEALRRYRDDIQNHGLLKKYFMLWGPVQCITFSIIPEHYRVAFIACVSFFWLIILSTISSKLPKPREAPVELLSAEVEEVKYPECELADGLTCNIDG
jgi:protein Mpv17